MGKFKEVEIELEEMINNEYKMTNFVKLPDNMPYKVTAKLVFEVPEEKLQLSREQVKSAIEGEYRISTILNKLGFKE
jgi:16S rRNA A1518/A1519 N6-dimethyltransferase RsmA/KsgA/DIM1 with predicted DNA glycosylase/AP lyase activity|tara:strand:- start:1930 stop:2160 length:231 start_codon:yes stop_codon:yes gene_type:complete